MCPTLLFIRTVFIHTTCNAESNATPTRIGGTCINGIAQAAMGSESRMDPSPLESAFSVHICLDTREKLIRG